ncbi:MAG: ABC transporter ATP-binding protein [Thermodesulfobacteriota bacterium]|nr:ABC transporter ATP-binding protein [Thermodesulfobacteriota bacterium]
MNLSIQNVSFSYDDEKVIDHVTLDFQKGNFYSILGPNGCGKTTLLDILVGHLNPNSGQVILEDKNLALTGRKEIAKKIALVSQNYNINFPFTVKEVVMMGRHPYIPRFSPPCKKDIDCVNSVMEKTGITRFRNKKITELSGGERQRCVFARALCQDTSWLLLDEAFSNMDISHTLSLLGIVKNEIKEKRRTVISVFHDINLASAWSDRLIFIKNGRVEVAGKADDVMTEKTIKNLFQVQAKVEYNEYVQAKQVYFGVEMRSSFKP